MKIRTGPGSHHGSFDARLVLASVASVAEVDTVTFIEDSADFRISGGPELVFLWPCNTQSVAVCLVDDGGPVCSDCKMQCMLDMVGDVRTPGRLAAGEAGRLLLLEWCRIVDALPLARLRNVVFHLDAADGSVGSFPVLCRHDCSWAGVRETRLGSESCDVTGTWASCRSAALSEKFGPLQVSGYGVEIDQCVVQVARRVVTSGDAPVVRRGVGTCWEQAINSASLRVLAAEGDVGTPPGVLGVDYPHAVHRHDARVVAVDAAMRAWHQAKDPSPLRVPDGLVPVVVDLELDYGVSVQLTDLQTETMSVSSVWASSRNADSPSVPLRADTIGYGRSLEEAIAEAVLSLWETTVALSKMALRFADTAVALAHGQRRPHSLLENGLRVIGAAQLYGDYSSIRCAGFEPLEMDSAAGGASLDGSTDPSVVSLVSGSLVKLPWDYRHPTSMGLADSVSTARAKNDSSGRSFASVHHPFSAVSPAW